MKILRSKKFELPFIYFISDREEIKDLPIGIPFIYGDAKSEEDYIRLIEYETLYQLALKSGYPFDFKKLLNKNGFYDIIKYDFVRTVYKKIESSGSYKDLPLLDPKDPLYLDKGIEKETISSYLRDATAYVDLEVLKNLNIFPIWLKTIEDSLTVNIHNFSVYDYNIYNKKLKGLYGDVSMSSPKRNLIIIDISGSIPKGVSSTTLTLSKNLAESFYADLLITGSKSTLYKYEELQDLDVNTLYSTNGTDNDQEWFLKLVTEEEREYETLICFGDNHNPGWVWTNKYNTQARKISEEEGKKLCKWKINKLISFHTTSSKELAGYSLWFKPNEIENMTNWVKYL